MTHTEKAEELIEKFGDKASGVVDEVIKQLEEMCKPEYTSFWHGEKAGETIEGYELIDYWLSVKQHLITKTQQHDTERN